MYLSPGGPTRDISPDTKVSVTRPGLPGIPFGPVIPFSPSALNANSIRPTYQSLTNLVYLYNLFLFIVSIHLITTPKKNELVGKEASNVSNPYVSYNRRDTISYQRNAHLIGSCGQKMVKLRSAKYWHFKIHIRKNYSKTTPSIYIKIRVC